MTVYLVRHAKAGDRSSWPGDDFFRPLSRRGQIQAEALVSQFAGLPIDRLLASPYIRCIETLVPLAGARVLAIEPLDPLAEARALEDAVALVHKHSQTEAVMCSHGDMIPMLLEHYANRGIDIGPNPAWPKGSTWMLDFDSTGEVVSARYAPPPVE
jgi:8-oxo-dGTP diphosphatase